MVDSQQAVIGLMREVLGDSYTSLRVKAATIREDFEEQTTAIDCEVIDNAGEKIVIAQEGVGIVDAFFRGVLERFAKEYASLSTIRFQEFKVAAELDTKHEFSGADSAATVTLEIANSEGRIFSFTKQSRSITLGAISATLEAAEYFINSEKAFISMFHALKDANERKRSDLIQRYTGIMATLVRNTSYSEVIASIREESGIAD